MCNKVVHLLVIRISVLSKCTVQQQKLYLMCSKVVLISQFTFLFLQTLNECRTNTYDILNMLFN